MTVLFLSARSDLYAVNAYSFKVKDSDEVDTIKYIKDYFFIKYLYFIKENFESHQDAKRLLLFNNNYIIKRFFCCFKTRHYVLYIDKHTLIYSTGQCILLIRICYYIAL